MLLVRAAIYQDAFHDEVSFWGVLHTCHHGHDRRNNPSLTIILHFYFVLLFLNVLNDVRNNETHERQRSVLADTHTQSLVPFAVAAEQRASFGALFLLYHISPISFEALPTFYQLSHSTPLVRP